MNLESYEKYFSNILARSFAKDSSKRHTAFKSSEVTQVYVEASDKDKNYILGKSKDYYFIVTYQEKPYAFSIALMHSDPVILLENFAHKDLFLMGNKPEEYVKKLFLKVELDNTLTQKVAPKKTFKI